MCLFLDANQRENPQLKKAETAEKYTLERIVKASLPLICLIQPVGALVQASALGMELYSEIKKCSSREDVVGITQKISLIAGLILLPVPTAIATHGYEVYQHLGKAYLAENYTDKGWELLKASHSIIYIASLVGVSAEILMISLVAQAGIEVYKTYQFASKGLTLEALVQAVVVVIRGKAAYIQTDRVKRNWYGKKLTQERLEELLTTHNVYKKKILKTEPVKLEGLFQPAALTYNASNRSKPFDLEKALATHNYSNLMENIDFSGQFLEATQFSHLHFENCNFSDTIVFQSRFEHCLLEETCFDYTLFAESDIHHCFFKNSSLIQTMFVNSSLHNLQFDACDLTYAIFYGTKLSDVVFGRSKLVEANFVGATASKCTIQDSDLQDTIMANTTFSLVNSLPTKTKPIIALETDFVSGYPEFVEGVALALRKQGATILFYHKYGIDFDEELLEKQVQKWAFNPKIRKGHHSKMSIPQQLLKKPDSELVNVRNFGSTIVKYADGVVIPGGENVEPIFYGQETMSPWLWGDYAHDMTEFAIVDAAYKSGKKIMGVCRGSQLINVYFGGTLKDVPHQFGFQDLQFQNDASSKAKGIIQNILQTNVIQGVSNHYQASDVIGKGLEVVLSYNGIPKAIVNDSGSVVLTQFHPEIFAFADDFDLSYFGDPTSYMSHTNLAANANFYNHLLECA